MPVELKWYEAEEKNLSYVFSGHWTWEECFAVIEKAAQELDRINYRVFLIIDFRPTHHIPPATFDALNRISRARPTHHPNNRGFIVIGLKSSLAMVFKVFQKIFPKSASRYEVVGNEAELEALLKRAENPS